MPSTDLASIEDYRAGLRTWLRDPASDLDPLRTGLAEVHTHEELAALGGRLQRRLFDAGWNRYGWPEWAGGLGGDGNLRGVLYDELWSAGLFVPETCLSLEVLAPAILRFNPEIGRRVLAPNLCGEEIWAQGFSEPEAGSDLASLRCRATLSADGTRYLVNGQKIWTSNAHIARWAFTLVRTGTPESRHRGITALWIDLEAPGVDVRALRYASGQSELSEMFFDDVAVPVENTIGAENAGWATAMYLLQFERGMYAWQRQAWLLARLADLTSRVKGASPSASRTIGRAYLAVIALRARCSETLRLLADGESPGPEVSVDKILLGTAEQLVLDAARELLSPALEVSDENWARHYRDQWFYTRAATIYGGSAEVQRGILADRVLNLPKEGR